MSRTRIFRCVENHTFEQKPTKSEGFEGEINEKGIPRKKKEEGREKREEREEEAAPRASSERVEIE